MISDLKISFIKNIDRHNIRYIFDCLQNFIDLSTFTFKKLIFLCLRTYSSSNYLTMIYL